MLKHEFEFQKNQKIKVGDTILTILEIRRDGCGTAVRIGIEGPKHIPVWREEIWLQRKDNDTNRNQTTL